MVGKNEYHKQLMSPTTKQKFIRRSKATRKIIIEKTAHIFNRKGYAGTSLADLTVATQLTKGRVYDAPKQPANLLLGDFDSPRVVRSEVKIAVKAVSVNFRDVSIINNVFTYPGETLPMILINGSSARNQLLTE